MIKELLGILGIIILLVEIYQFVRQYYLGRLLEKSTEKRPLKPPVLRPKTERDCQFCREGKGKRIVAQHEMLESWQHLPKKNYPNQSNGRGKSSLGCKQSWKHQKGAPDMMAGLTERIWTM